MAKYSDLNLDFVPHPLTGDVTVLTDMEALKRSIRNLVYTSKYERRFRPELDAGVRKYLFEPLTSITCLKIKNAIENIIKQQEKRVELIEVSVSGNERTNSFDVSIVFRPKNVRDVTNLSLTLTRTR